MAFRLSMLVPARTRHAEFLDLVCLAIVTWSIETACLRYPEWLLVAWLWCEGLQFDCGGRSWVGAVRRFGAVAGNIKR